VGPGSVCFCVCVCVLWVINGWAEVGVLMCAVGGLIDDIYGGEREKCFNIKSVST